MVWAVHGIGTAIREHAVTLKVILIAIISTSCCSKSGHGLKDTPDRQKS